MELTVQTGSTYGADAPLIMTVAVGANGDIILTPEQIIQINNLKWLAGRGPEAPCPYCTGAKRETP